MKWRAHHAEALHLGRPGERYILGGENLTLKQILDKMSAITGLPSPTRKVPHSVAMVFAFFDETITGKLRGKEPRATVEAVRMGKKKMFASSAKAVQELGFRQVPVYQALRAAIDMVSRAWLCSDGSGSADRDADSMNSRIAIIAALPREISSLVHGWQADENNAEMLIAWSDKAVVVCAGMGTVRARMAAEEALKHGPLHRMISAGWCGALNPGLKGAVCVGRAGWSMQ